ncbi:MAG: hypothetical protein OCD02_20240 [Spirochaetaceae bacterium]
MQIDMHYYGTYALARAAGLKKDIVHVIATASQFVNDNSYHEDIELPDGATVNPVVTAHHPVNKSYIEKKDQHKVWVPFHFLPGNEGDTYYDRLVCKKNSPTAKDVLEYVFFNKDKDYFAELVGIVAHVYADTFSHYGFSGITNHNNSVKSETITVGSVGDVLKHLDKQKEKFLVNYANTLSLGHGGVFTNPDRPYLYWSFEFGNDVKDRRDNHQTFMEGSEALFNYFKKIGELRPEFADPDINLTFNHIKEDVAKILSQQKPLDGRIEAWKHSVKSRDFLGSVKEDIPNYRSWNEDLRFFNELTTDLLNKLNVYRFFQAASIYRTFVLKELLPKHGLIVG